MLVLKVVFQSALKVLQGGGKSSSLRHLFYTPFVPYHELSVSILEQLQSCCFKPPDSILKTSMHTFCIATLIFTAWIPGKEVEIEHKVAES